MTTSRGRPKSSGLISDMRRGMNEAGRSMANMHRKITGRMSLPERAGAEEAASPGPDSASSSSMNSMAMTVMVRVS